jgi:hypothetical protein
MAEAATRMGTRPSAKERSPTANIASHGLLCDSIRFFGLRFWYVSTTCLSAEEAGWARRTVSGLTPGRRRVSRGINCAPANPVMRSITNSKDIYILALP